MLLFLKRNLYPSGFVRTSPPSSSEQSLCPLLHLTCLHWVSVSLVTSVLCSDPLPSAFVPSSRLLSLWPSRHPSVSVATLPASALVVHGHPLVLQRALYLSSSETTLPQASVFPQSTLAFPPPCRMPLFGPRSPEDISTPFRSPPEDLIVSAILCLSLCPRFPRPPEPPRSCHDAARDCPRAPRHPSSSAALFVSLSYSDRTPPQAVVVPHSSLTLFTAV